MKNRVIERLTINRTELIEILLVGFLIGVCASVIGSIIFDTFKENISKLNIAIILILCVSIFVLSRKLVSSGKAKISINGFIVYLKNENIISSVPRYRYSQSISGYLNSAFSENNALKKQWDKQPLSNVYDDGKHSDSSEKLIKEATEYYAIERLSIHLTDYFNKEKYDKSELKKFSREDVPSILLNNRLMEIFSTPMENRAAFTDDAEDKDCERIVMSTSRSGAFFSKFDLVLPKDSKVTRENEKIIIDTSNFKLTLNIIFEGVGYLTPINFEKHYLGLNNYSDFSNYKVSLKAEVNFKLKSFFSRSKWDYHAWLDGYFEALNNDMSGDSFFSRINWETASTIIQCKSFS